MYSKVTLIGVVAAAAMAFAAPAAWGDSWGADRLAQAKQEAQHAASSYPDWFERYVAAHSIREPVGDDHFRDSPDTAPVSGTSGTEADWPQIGLGLGFGVVLALGVFLAVRPTRVRPLPR